MSMLIRYKRTTAKKNTIESVFFSINLFLYQLAIVKLTKNDQHTNKILKFINF